MFLSLTKNFRAVKYKMSKIFSRFARYSRKSFNFQSALSSGRNATNFGASRQKSTKIVDSLSNCLNYIIEYRDISDQIVNFQPKTIRSDKISGASRQKTWKSGIFIARMRHMQISTLNTLLQR